MKDRLEECIARGVSTPERHECRYPTIDDTDREIMAAVERGRKEYYEAWFNYITEFGDSLFF